MSDRDLKVSISGKLDPSLTSAFRQVTDGAQKMGTSVETSSKKSSAALRDMSKAQQDIALGAAALTASFTLAARGAQDQVRQIDALNRLYGTSADEILKLSEAIQANTNFSNDAARQAAITGSTLAQNYQLSAEQIGVLIERSADLAQIHGVTLQDAMSRVAGAIRGEGEAAELLALNLSDSAVASAAAAAGLTGWTTTMTEAEKAAFRYTLVLEQTESIQGAAGDAANTTAGFVKNLQNEFQDLSTSVVSATGPLAEIAGSLGEQSIQAGLAVGGLVKLGSGLKVLAASAGLTTAALGPIGLALAALAAGVAIYQLTKSTDEFAGVAKEARESATTLALALKELAASGSENAAAGSAWMVILKSAEAQMGSLGEATSTLKKLQEQLNDVGRAGADTEKAQAMKRSAIDALEAQIALQEAAILGLNNQAEAELALAAVLTNTGTGAELATEAVAELYAQYAKDHDILHLINGLVDIGKHLSDFDIKANEAEKAAANAAKGVGLMDRAIKDLLSGPKLSDFEIDPDQLVGGTGPDMIVGAIFDAAMERIPGVIFELDRVRAAWLAYAPAAHEAALATHDTMGFFASLGNIAADTTLSITRMAAAQELVTGFSEDHDAFLGGFIGHLQEEAAALEDLRLSTIETAQAVGILDTAAKQLQTVDWDRVWNPAAGGMMDEILDTVVGLQNTGAALGDVFGAIVGGTNAIGQQIESVAKWAEELIGVEGEQSKLDDLLANGVITLGEYNAAQSAGTAIMDLNAAAQEKLLGIQARQAPVLADLAEKQNDYIDGLADLPQDQQLAALGFLDAAESAKVMELAMLAANAAQSEVGSGARKSAAAIIQAAAESDPVLAAMLEQTGQISYELDELTGERTMKVNLDGGETIQSALDSLDSTLKNLITTLWQIYVKSDNSDADENIGATKDKLHGLVDPEWLATVEADTASANENLDGTQTKLNTIVGQSWNADVGVNDGASGTLSGILGQLNAIDGFNAVSSVTTVTNLITNDFGTTFKRHGGVVPFRDGGVAAMGIPLQNARNGFMTPGGAQFIHMNEAGGEDVLVPSGSLIRNAPASAMARNQAARRGGGGGAVLTGPHYWNVATPDLYHVIESQKLSSARR